MDVDQLDREFTFQTREVFSTSYVIDETGINKLSGENLVLLVKDTNMRMNKMNSLNQQYFMLTGQKYPAHEESVKYSDKTKERLEKEIRIRKAWLGDFDGRTWEEK